MENRKLLLSCFIDFAETISAFLRNENNRIVLAIFSLLESPQRTLRTGTKIKAKGLKMVQNFFDNFKGLL